MITGVRVFGYPNNITIMETRLAEICSKDVCTFVNMISLATRTRFSKAGEYEQQAPILPMSERLARNIPIALIIAQKGEGKAHTCEMAWFRQLTMRHLGIEGKALIRIPHDTFHFAKNP